MKLGIEAVVFVAVALTFKLLTVIGGWVVRANFQISILNRASHQYFLTPLFCTQALALLLSLFHLIISHAIVIVKTS